MEWRWERYKIPNRVGTDGPSQPSIGSPGLSRPRQEGLLNSQSIWKKGRVRMGLDLYLFRWTPEREQKMSHSSQTHRKISRRVECASSAQAMLSTVALHLVGIQIATEWFTYLEKTGPRNAKFLGCSLITVWIVRCFWAAGKLNWIRSLGCLLCSKLNISG